MAYISKITPLGSSTTYDLKASLLINTHVTSEAAAIPATKGLFGVYTTTSDSSGLSNDGHILSGTWHNNDSNFGYQLFIDTDPTYKMALRQRNSSGVWQAWKLIPMADGTNASGTWGISITGNAATATALSTSGTTAKFWRGDNTWSDTISGGTLKITANSNTTIIGSQNASFCHIYNSENIPFIFNNSVLTTGGNLGDSSYPFDNLTLGRSNGAGIYYKGTKNTYRMIRFIDNTSDIYGNGIAIGGGGQTIIGGGESADTAAAQAGTAGGEIMQVCNDGKVELIANLQNGWDDRKVLSLNTDGYLWCPSYINVPTSNNENPTISQFIVTNGSDNFYRKASAAHAMAAIRSNASGTWGISITGNAATAKQLLTEGDNRADATAPNGYNNNLVFRGLKNNTAIGSPSSDSFSYVVGLRGWQDSSGGNAYELAFNNTGIFCRNGATTSWGSWNKILTTQDGQTRYHVGDTATNSYYLIKINPATSWMLNFTLTLYDSYVARDIQISGYNYGSNHWYAPSAVILGSNNINATTVYFGYTADWNLYVAVAAGNYGGAAITNYCNGYTQIESTGLFTITKVNSLPGTIQTTQTIYRPWYRGEAITGAVWNDYAEYRKDNPNEIQEPGRCIKELGDGSLALTTKRLERGCEIVSDTFGFAIGKDEDNGYNTPIASNGRVLAYPYESIEEFVSHIGWPVCSGPNGTVSIMTEEEEAKYSSRIIGTISEIPTYEEWGTGNVKVNGRVWIRIR